MGFENFASPILKEKSKKEKQKRKMPKRLPDTEANLIYESNKLSIKALRKKIEKESPGSPFASPREPILALARLVIELRDKLPKYETVLSDDASGRLVSLLLRKIIDTKRKELDLPPVKTFFIAAGRHHNPDKDKAIAEFIENKKEEFGKTLLVTEYIESGKGISHLIETLENKEIDFDLATVSIMKESNEYHQPFVKHLYYGVVGQEGMPFYGQKLFSGVIKSSKYSSPHPEVVSGLTPDKRKNIEKVREDINMLADEFVKLVP